MRECKSCHITLGDHEENCPLCGAHTSPVASELVITSGEYPKKDITKTSKYKVRNVFVGISVILMAAFLLVSVLSKNWAYALITVTAISFVWLTILRNIFYSRNLCQILTRIGVYILIYFNLIMLHFYFTTHDFSILNAAIGIVTPIILAIMNVVYMMIVFISKKWYMFAFNAIILSVVEIALLIVTIFTPISYVASIIPAALGVATIVFSFVFGKNVMIAEFKKRLFM